MKQISTFLTLLFITVSMPALSQEPPSYYDLTFAADSIRAPFKVTSSNYVFVRSKRGVDGVNPTFSADSIKSLPISKIILVFSEEGASDIETREEYNQERWENLMLTYPEFFQTNTKYKNICQCTAESGGADYKQVQGFYIYYKTSEPEKKAEPVATKSEPSPVKKEAPAKLETPAKKEAIAEAVTTAAAVTAVAVAVPDAKTKEPKESKDLESIEEPEAKPSTTALTGAELGNKKKAGYAKPKRSKDPKACRPACYGYGDEDLNEFFRTSLLLSKKQKRQAKKATVELKLQLNFDGTIKKALAVSTNEELKQAVLGSVKAMSTWNPAVKSGVTVKSEVRIKLKYDKSSKTMLPFEVIINPRPNPKCKCVSDEELFGS